MVHIASSKSYQKKTWKLGSKFWCDVTDECADYSILNIFKLAWYCILNARKLDMICLDTSANMWSRCLLWISRLPLSLFIFASFRPTLFTILCKMFRNAITWAYIPIKSIMDQKYVCRRLSALIKSMLWLRNIFHSSNTNLNTYIKKR